MKRRAFYAYHINFCGSEQDAKAGILADARLTLQNCEIQQTFIRNLRTGVEERPDKRTASENEVIETVRIGIEMANESFERSLTDSRSSCRSACKRPAHKDQKRIDNKQKKHPIMPTSDHWMSHETLDAVMKNIKNPDYDASQANHRYFEILKDRKYTLNCWHHIVKSRKI